MAVDWMRLLQGPDFAIDGNAVLVHLGKRSHKLHLEDRGESLQLRAVVLQPATARTIPDRALRAWRRNRITPLVGFRLDKRQLLIAEAWVPKVGLTAEELRLYARAVASESDRFEFELTGKDVE